MATALVTGASRGVGRGIATGLADSGFRVFGTGRSIASANLAASVARVPCDHTNDAETAEVFDRVRSEAGSLNLLVNCAWGGYERMVENGAFTWGLPFWQQTAHRWSSMMDAGAWGGLACGSEMIEARSGLIVNISFWAAQKHIGNHLWGF